MSPTRSSTAETAGTTTTFTPSDGRCRRLLRRDLFARWRAARHRRRPADDQAPVLPTKYTPTEDADHGGGALHDRTEPQWLVVPCERVALPAGRRKPPVHPVGGGSAGRQREDHRDRSSASTASSPSSSIFAGALLTRWLVTLTFRSLGQVESTAMSIAAGDFSQRLTDIEPEHTEVGRLKIAINAMLGRVDAALTQRDSTVAADAPVHRRREPRAAHPAGHRPRLRGALPDGRHPERG